VKLGAIDYLTKPFDILRLKQLLRQVKDEIARRRRLLQAEQEVARNVEFCGMIGRGPTMQELFRLIRRLAPHARTPSFRPAGPTEIRGHQLLGGG
jgi:DNA-binding NtrC family response regulator